MPLRFVQSLVFFLLGLLAAGVPALTFAQESLDMPATCSDGLDNDSDGRIDNFDEGCNPLADPSFEGYTSCPDDEGEFGVLLPAWDLVQGTADLFVYSDGACNFRPTIHWGSHLDSIEPDAPLDGFAYGALHNKGEFAQETIIQNLSTPLPSGQTYEFRIFSTKLDGGGPEILTAFDAPEDRPFKVYGLRTGTPTTGPDYNSCDIDSTSPNVDALGLTGLVTTVGEWQEVAFTFEATESYDRIIFTVECDDNFYNNTFLLIDGLTFGLEGTPPNLAVTVDDGATSWRPATAATYTVALTNNGSGNAEATDLDGMLPAGASIAAPGVTCTAGGFATCGSITGSAGDTSYQVDGAELPADPSGGTTLTYTVPLVFSGNAADYPGGVFPIEATHQVTVSDPAEPKAALDDNTATDVDLLAAVGLAKTGVVQDGGDGTADAGDSVAYTFDLTNTGGVTLTGVTLGDPLPGLSAITCPGGLPIPSLAPAASVTCAATLTLTQALVDAGLVENTATAGSDQDASAADSATVLLPEMPALGLAKRVVSVQELGGGVFEVEFALVAENLGNVTLSQVQITDDLAVTFPAPSSATVLAGPTATGSLVANEAFDGEGDIRLLNAATSTLAAGASGTLSFTLQVDLGGASGPFENSASGSATGAGGTAVEDISDNGEDPDSDGDGVANEPGENDPTPVPTTGAPEIVATKVGQFDPATQDRDHNGVLSEGDALTYVLSVANEGTSNALGVLLEDTPDANTTLVVGSVVTNRGVVTLGNMAGDETVLVDLGTLGLGEAAEINFEVLVADPLPADVDEISNQATVSGTNFESLATDDPGTTQSDDATVVVIAPGAIPVDIPTLSEWGFLLFALALLTGALARLRRSPLRAE